MNTAVLRPDAFLAASSTASYVLCKTMDGDESDGEKPSAWPRKVLEVALVTMTTVIASLIPTVPRGLQQGGIFVQHYESMWEVFEQGKNGQYSLAPFRLLQNRARAL